MTDRERLIELLEQKQHYGIAIEMGVNYIYNTKLADHLIANGVILPPCKVGDKIYMLVTRHTTSFEFPNGKMVRKENQHTIIKQTHLTKSNFFKVLEDFGKTVFLTKEEAEAKLKEMKK